MCPRFDCHRISGIVAYQTSDVYLQREQRYAHQSNKPNITRWPSCESVLGDLIDNLEDDFPGRQYTEGDIYALINDRFCYGVKWVFRSPCRYILQKYMDEVIELIMVEATEREICEQLRFCW